MKSDELGRLRAALRQETRVALDYQKQRDEWKRQSDVQRAARMPGIQTHDVGNASARIVR